MKIVANKWYGDFGISDEAFKILGTNFNYDDRTSPQLISLIEEKGAEFVEDDYSALAIVEIPDEITDWEIDDYDGYETVIYVLDGKINRA